MLSGMGRPGEFERRVVEVLSAIRVGDVVTYGEVAAEAGYPGAARAVGNVLATSEGLPWWRVVAADGRLVPGHEWEQARRLRREGVTVSGGRVRRARPRRARPAVARRGGPGDGASLFHRGDPGR